MNVTDLPAELLHSQHIALLPPDPKRASEMHQLIEGFSDSHYEFLAWAKEPVSAEDTERNMIAARNNFDHDKDEYKFLIIHKDTDKLMGCISLFIRHPRIPYFEIGYWISTAAMGQGVITEACRLIRDLACEHLKAIRLEIRMASKNSASIKVALRCGFQCEAVLANHRINGSGDVDDTCIYVYQPERR